MTTIWERMAKEWRISKPKINKARLEEDIRGNLDNVMKTIEKSNSVPSVLDAINADADDDDW
ncbi:hypothetical protein BW900_16370 [Bacillus mycoides]|uniref:Uncharacterized protein n=1 Tax=Bacillus mycoides TaxID=1405 RepID=A0A1S9T6W9_BACMY|nr:hypothetical protein [Bacillus mycoides]OOR05652.1 hypothetical protein BW900_16370 [Bacillus mycoides]QWI36657.1 hypothetical protein EXW43_05645 [Bacillus mycoides]